MTSRLSLSSGVAAVGLLAALLASCGIDTLSYLSEKPVSLSSDTAALTFRGPVSSESMYYGIDVFYRIYATESDATSDYSNVVSKQSATTAVPGSVTENYLISSLDYLMPVLVDADSAIPTIAADDAVGLVSIEFSENAEPVMIITDTSGAEILNTVIRRNVMASGQYLTFLDEPESGDADFRSRTTDTDGIYYVQIFGAAYGLDYSSFDDLYGDAVLLGRLTLNF